MRKLQEMQLMKNESAKSTTTVRLGDIANISQGSILTRVEDRSGTPAETISMMELSYYCLQNDSFPETKIVSLNDKSRSKCVFTEKGDVLVGLSSAKAMVIEGPRTNKLVLSNFAVIRINDTNYVDPYYLCWLFNENSGISKTITTLSQGMTRVSVVPLSELKELNIELPGIEEQRKIGKTYDLLRQLTRLERRKSSIRYQLVNQNISKSLKGGN